MKLLLKITLGVLIALNCSCSENAPSSSYLPDFDMRQHATQTNVYIFTNTTQGENYYWRWDFGNGGRTDREEIVQNEKESFYPEQGTYDITLTIWGDPNDLADNKQVTKQLTVDNDVLTAAFSVQSVTNKVNTYCLRNETSGNYDKITWVVNGRELIDKGNEVEVYFPFKGQNKVVLKVSLGDYMKEVVETVIIEADDPDFKSHYSIVWGDEFDGNSIDTEKWKFETGQHGWGNAEWQNYTNGDNVEVVDGKLKIVAKKVGAGQKVGDYTSARLNAKKSFTYGIFEVNAKLPDYKGPGHWPAIWMLGESIQNGTNWPLCGEIDIMEYVSWDPNKTSSSIHIESNNHAKGNAIGSGHLPLESAEEAFHTYGLIWTENFLRFYRDDVNNVILTYRKPNNANAANWPFDEPFYYLLNIAVGGNYGGVGGVDDSIFPATMEVDYVRVYQFNQI